MSMLVMLNIGHTAVTRQQKPSAEHRPQRKYGPGRVSPLSLTGPINSMLTSDVSPQKTGNATVQKVHKIVQFWHSAERLFLTP